MAKKKKLTMAQRADKHVLYEKSVQAPDAELDFVTDTFRKLRGRKPVLLREDFCGTANISCAWVRRSPKNRAIGVDIDPDVLEWSRRHKVSALTASQAARLKLIQSDVRTARCQRADATLALNFSYFIFKTRREMKGYFRRVHAGLVRDGILFLDAFGGYEAFQEMEEATPYNGFTYVWDQARYNPVNGHILCHIHFRFRDGSRMRRAFTYDWRLWTLPELTEMLEESGFRTTVYWEGTAEDGGGNGEFTPVTEADADPAWLAYIVAEKI